MPSRASSSARSFSSWPTWALSATERAHTIYKQLLADYEAPPLDPAIDEELKAYMARRHEEIGTEAA